MTINFKIFNSKLLELMREIHKSRDRRCSIPKLSQGIYTRAGGHAMIRYLEDEAIIFRENYFKQKWDIILTEKGKNILGALSKLDEATKMGVKKNEDSKGSEKTV